VQVRGSEAPADVLAALSAPPDGGHDLHCVGGRRAGDGAGHVPAHLRGRVDVSRDVAGVQHATRLSSGTRVPRVRRAGGDGGRVSRLRRHPPLPDDVVAGGGAGGRRGRRLRAAAAAEAAAAAAGGQRAAVQVNRRAQGGVQLGRGKIQFCTFGF